MTASTLPTRYELAHEIARVAPSVLPDLYRRWHDLGAKADDLADELRAILPTCRGGSDCFFGFTFDAKDCIVGVRVMVGRFEIYCFDFGGAK